MRATVPFLRPCSRSRCRPLSVRPRFYGATGIQQRRQNSAGPFEKHKSRKWPSRLNDLSGNIYPRILASESVISCQDFVENYAHLGRGDRLISEHLTIRGMVVCLSLRTLAYASRKDTIVSFCEFETCLH